jgi:hypothetical protein
MSTRLPRFTAILVAAAALTGTLASAAQAGTLYTGLLARGTGSAQFRCSLTNLGDRTVEVESILVRDADNTPVSAASNVTLEAGESFTHATTLPEEGRCVFTFQGGKSKLRGVACTAPGVTSACTAVLGAS